MPRELDQYDDLKMRWPGLQFQHRAMEHAYQEWRVDYGLPFHRLGISIGGLTWLSLPLMLHIWIPQALTRPLLALLTVVVLVHLPAVTLVFRTAARRWAVHIVSAFNGLTGCLAIWIMAGPLGLPGAAQSTMVLFALYAIFMRMPPRWVLAALSAHTILIIGLALERRDAEPFGSVEMLFDVMIPLITTATTLVVCAVAEHAARRAFRSETIIARQGEALEAERAQISRFLAPEVTALIQTQGIEATLTQRTLEITAICCDLRGFTAYTERYGARAMGATLQEYYARIVDAAKHHGGTIKDFAGDGALILVGAPVPNPAHAATALTLAREVVCSVREMTERLSSADAPLGIGAGVASGECAVGAVGSQSRLEYTAVGSAVNLSARLCAQAKDGQILIAPRTAESVSPDPGWRMKPIRFKGIADELLVRIETVAC